MPAGKHVTPRRKVRASADEFKIHDMAWKLQPKYKSWSEWAREVLANASVQAIQAAENATVHGSNRQLTSEDA